MRDSEVNIAATDLILLLGYQPDITDDFTYDKLENRGILFRKAQL